MGAAGRRPVPGPAARWLLVQHTSSFRITGPCKLPPLRPHAQPYLGCLPPGSLLIFVQTRRRRRNVIEATAKKLQGTPAEGLSRADLIALAGAHAVRITGGPQIKVWRLQALFNPQSDSCRVVHFRGPNSSIFTSHAFQPRAAAAPSRSSARSCARSG